MANLVVSSEYKKALQIFLRLVNKNPDKKYYIYPTFDGWTVGRED